ncbi:MAG: dTDP-glucose 4,6-dehydratase [Kiritimatiellia bacterium]
MKLLVTGGAGFIGSNFIRFLLSERPDTEIVNMDALTYAGNLERLSGLKDERRLEFVKGNIADPGFISEVMSAYSFDAVVNFAAETHVDRSLHIGVTAFIAANVGGVQVLLDACREHGVERFVQISTDEVYGSLGREGSFTEKSPIEPNNPYAATKAGADMLVRAAHKSYGLDTVITRCSNNFGPCQFPEKLIPLMIANALEDKPLPVYGDGMHVRDWIYVADHCAAVDLALRRAEPGSVYNIGGEHDVPNLEIVRSILRLLDKPESLIRYIEDRPGHDRRYAMDASLITEELGWRRRYDFEEALKSTVDWYVNNRPWWERVRTGEYRDFYEKLYAKRLDEGEAGKSE